MNLRNWSGLGLVGPMEPPLCPPLGGFLRTLMELLQRCRTCRLSLLLLSSAAVYVSACLSRIKKPGILLHQNCAIYPFRFCVRDGF